MLDELYCLKIKIEVQFLFSTVSVMLKILFQQIKVIPHGTYSTLII